MKITSKFLSYFKLDQSYSLLNCRNVSVLLEFFCALDIRGIMALDGIITIITNNNNTTINFSRT